MPGIVRFESMVGYLARLSFEIRNCKMNHNQKINSQMLASHNMHGYLELADVQ